MHQQIKTTNLHLLCKTDIFNSYQQLTDPQTKILQWLCNIFVLLHFPSRG